LHVIGRVRRQIISAKFPAQAVGAACEAGNITGLRAKPQLHLVIDLAIEKLLRLNTAAHRNL
jgi:hypothetical protein